ncbi:MULTISPECIES: hypothetical protein [Acinetobacter]|uniref:Uncharacterized protein n=1 Tax=Acinetobacter indicus TaxID=756892 RepID=A0A6C0Y8Y2_9GAMM|nr:MULTISPECIES: hypothetical protein [Acinetobacter]QIC72055.1 hypothetical protein FSC09_17000 [Acinetobacter indicus]QKQ71544.1 hypothetical protein E5Y90_15030 [Acinetobacter sp. 10FS3-1]
MSNIENKTRPTISERDNIAMQHTLQSAISSEFQDFSFEEKVALASVLYVAFVEALNTGEPISPSIDYKITPETYNQFLAYSLAKDQEYSQAPLKALTLQEISHGVNQIFERHIDYHKYHQKKLMICKARIIPSFTVTTKGQENKEVTALKVNICIALIPELNKILVESKGSLSTALKLTNQLLNDVQSPIKDIF